jgi:hypothetical protein
MAVVSPVRMLRVPRVAPWSGLCLALLAASAPALAQWNSDIAQLARSQGSPDRPAGGDASRDFAIQNGVPYRSALTGAQRAPYNVRLGRATARFTAGIAFTYNDNLVLADQAIGGGGTDDFIIAPNIGIALEYPLSRNNSFRVDVGIGYQKHINFTAFDALTIAPNSALDYRLIIGDVLITFFNQTSTPSEIAQRPEIVGTGDPLAVTFRRIVNSAGISAAYQPTESVTFSTGYNYQIERGLVGGAFDVLDRDTHSISAAVYKRLNPIWTVGLSGSWNSTSFTQEFQNNSIFYSGGALAAWHPSRFVNISAAVRYTVSSFDSGQGTIADTAEFSGITYDITATHILGRNLNHALTIASGVNNGFGSNFTESFSVNYGINWAPTERFSASASVGYTHARQSNVSQFQLPLSFTSFPGASSINAPIRGTTNSVPVYFQRLPAGSIPQAAAEIFVPPVGNPVVVARGVYSLPGADVTDLIQFTASANQRLGRRLNGTLSYTYAFRDGSFVGQAFHQNVIALSLTYQF